MERDRQFKEHKVIGVSTSGEGWFIELDDGFSFYVPPAGIEPKEGMVARMYGKGLGFRIRGLLLDGQTVFYRTEAEDETWFQAQLYGATIAEWLERWDSGKGVWSIEMGGLGPGYEQAIQVTLAEVIRHMLKEDYIAHAWEDNEIWKQDYEKIEQWGFKDEKIKSMGLSGAQWGAAVNLARHLYKDGPIKTFTDERVKDRHIQVSKNFP